MAVKLPENNRHWTTNWEFRVSDKPPTTNLYAGHGDFSGTTPEETHEIIEEFYPNSDRSSPAADTSKKPSLNEKLAKMTGGPETS